MINKKFRFKSEIHFGLLVIILILLILNFASNLIIYRVRSNQREMVTNKLKISALSISRELQTDFVFKLTTEQAREFKKRYKISGIILIPFKPENEEPETIREWFKGIVSNLPPGQLPEIAQKLLSSDFKTLTRGENSEYFYVYPVPSYAGKKLLIISDNVPELASLDDSSHALFILGITSILLIALAYFSLYRFILAPFQKIKKEALHAGRSINADGDDVEEMVREYQQIINELKDKEAELLILNDAITRKANSLEHFNQYLLASMSSGIITLDNNGNVLTINESAGIIFNLERDKYINCNIGQLLSGASGLLAAIDQSIKFHINLPYQEYDLKLSDDRILSLGVTISVIYDNRDNPIGTLVLFNDMTELKNLRKELEDKERLAALGEMSGGLAHQLRNSLGAILGYSNLVKKRMMKNNLNIETLTALEDESKEAESLVQRFLSFTRPFDFEAKPIVLDKLIKDILENFNVRSDCHHISFIYDSSEKDISHIECDGLLLKQALTNIIENGINAYDGQEGTIEIRTTSGNNKISIEIIDRACGIPDDAISKIFTPFYSSNPSGTGLGLPLAKKIVDLHRGKLGVTSKVAEGTIFTIILPCKTQTIAVNTH